jgi:hypothetical protein
MSVFTRSINFNDTTATISFPNKLDSSNQLNWTVSLSSGTNKASTNGNVTIEPYTKPVSTSPVTSWPSSVTSYPAEDKAKHVEFIKEALNTVDTASGRDAKAACAKMLYDYLLIWGMDFIKAHDNFKKTVIAKAYELKSQAPEKTSMAASMNKVLTALDQPLEKPVTALPGSVALPASPPGLTRQVACGGSLTYCGCDECPDLTYKPTTEPSKTVSEMKPTTKEIPYNPDMSLFIALAKKHDAKWANENPTTYFSYYENGVKWGSFKGSTKAERMNDYLSRWSNGAEREKLMKSLFTKNGLVFSDAVMTLYDEWQKTYKPTGSTNRYKKMCVFIDAHKSLFTTA